MLRPTPESLDFLRGQYGYRESKSIVDEIRQALMRSIVEERAISLNIMNAFNILSWDRMATLKYHEVSAIPDSNLNYSGLFSGKDTRVPEY